MASAEGQVQNLKYRATFPLLLNIADEPTYFMALKDTAGLVKMYAMVNVQQYQIGTELAEQVDALSAVRGDVRGIALVVQIQLQQLGDVLIVLDNQNTLCHKAPSREARVGPSLFCAADAAQSFIFLYYRRYARLCVNFL